jgi:hypothetical protein
MTAALTATRTVPVRQIQAAEEARIEAIAAFDEIVVGVADFRRRFDDLPEPVIEAMGTLARLVSNAKAEVLRLTAPEPTRAYVFGGPARFPARVEGGTPR